MESMVVCLRHDVLLSTNNNNKGKFQKTRRKKHQQTSPTFFHIQHHELEHSFRSGCCIRNYKQSSSHFQDFQRYSKPLRLLPATELKVCEETLRKNTFSSFGVDSSRSLVKVELRTSNIYGSSISDQNAGILLCLIDSNGDSILQRIPVILDDTLQFQQGSVDEFTFEGPKLDGIEALWISVESGQWRLGGLTLMTLSICQPSLEGNDGEKIQYTGFQYKFEVDDILLGEGTGISMVELRPCLTSELSGSNPFTLWSKSSLQSTPPPGGTTSSEEGMREYANLKLSLLSYNALLVFVGTTIANFSAGENAAFAFFIGGISGFSYLLLLQRSVDGLPASPSASGNKGGIDQLLRGIKGPISSLALALVCTFVAVKYSDGDIHLALTPKDLLAGMMGFLACKVAVVLTAFKPMTLSLKENE